MPIANTYAFIIAGLALGIFLGYEFSATLSNIEPYRSIGLKILG
jgi:hypothetical protein